MASQADGGSTLEERIRAIEDRLEIYNLIASHPPSADTGAAEFTASVWAEDGEFDRGAQFPAPPGAAVPEHRGEQGAHRAFEQAIARISPGCLCRVTGDTTLRTVSAILVPAGRPPLPGTDAAQPRAFTSTGSRQHAGVSSARPKIQRIAPAALDRPLPEARGILQGTFE